MLRVSLVVAAVVVVVTRIGKISLALFSVVAHSDRPGM
jgi:hypothetical protein